MKRLHLFLLLLCTVLFGCSKDETTIIPDAIETESDFFTADANAGTFTITLNASHDWTAEQDHASQSWCHISTPSGTNDIHTLELLLDENTSYDERNAAIYLKCGTVQKIVTLTQKQKDALILNSNKVELEAGEQNFKIQIKTNLNVNYQIDSNAQGWLQETSKNPSRGLTEKVFSFTALANEGFTTRQGTITLKADNGMSEEIQVYQEGDKQSLILTNPDKTIVDSKGGDLIIELKSNVEYRMVLPKVDWIKENVTRGISTFTHYLSVAPNESYDPRSAQLYVEAVDGSVADSITIEQMEKDAILLAKSKYEFDAHEQQFDVFFESNVQFETRCSDDWISQKMNQTKGLSKGKMTFQVSENISPEKRIGHIYFSFEEIKQEIVVEQAGRTNQKSEIFKLRHAEKTFNPIHFVGKHMSGTAKWGDGTRTKYNEGHVYTDSKEREVVFETMGVDSFMIDSVKSISWIEFEVVEKKTEKQVKEE